MFRFGARSVPARLVPLMLSALLFVACAETAGPDQATDVEDVPQQDQPEAFDETRFFENPDEFLGQEVTVSGEVTEVLRPRAFRLSRVGGGETSLLVVGAEEANVARGQVVRVTGTVLRFDVPNWVRDFGQDVGVDFNDPVFQQFAGRASIVAQSVTVIEGADPGMVQETDTPTAQTTTATPR